MAINLTNADNALKTVYLDVIANQLDNYTNPFFARIKKTTSDVWGKEVRRLAIHGVNGGIGAGTEDGDLPEASGNDYKQFVTTLKNLYGTIEISDKAVRASQNSAGAFVNLLNAEMESLINSSKYNFSRMLFGDGSGKLGTVVSATDGVFTLSDVKGIAEGMIIDIRDTDGNLYSGAKGRKVLAVNRADKTVKISGSTLVVPDDIAVGAFFVIQGSYNNELTGLEAIFGNSSTLYGLSRSENPWLNPYVQDNVGAITELKLQTALDAIEENSGSPVNLIICSWGVRRALQKVLSDNKRFIETTDLEGGFKSISYNGIPIVADRFCKNNTMYLLNTDAFALHQLCDWQWLSDDDGKVLRQIAGKAVYSATLVKYADLICTCPQGQGCLTGITEN